MNPASFFTRVLRAEVDNNKRNNANSSSTNSSSSSRNTIAASPSLQQQQQQQIANNNNISSSVSSSSLSSSSPNLDASIPDLPSTDDSNLDSELVPFHSFLHDLSSSITAPTPIQREEILFRFFTQLRHSSPQAQLQALDLLSSFFQSNPRLILGCNNLLALIIRILQSSTARNDGDVSEVGITIYCKLFWMVSGLSEEHMNVRDFKRFFRILRRIIERKSPPLLCRLMMSSMCDMASGNNRATEMYVATNTSNNTAAVATTSTSSSPPLPPPPPPSACFDFSSIQSALALPPIEKFLVNNKGYTVCIWIRAEMNSDSSSASSSSSSSSSTVASATSSSSSARALPLPLPVAQPISRNAAAAASASNISPPGPLAHLQPPPQLSYIYSFLTDKARGIEALIGKKDGHIVIRSCSRGVLQELNTEVKLPHKKWVLLSIVHKKPQTFSRSSGSVSVYLNDECKYNGELSYPQLPDSMIFNAFGAATHPSKPSSPFLGRMSTISFHQRALSPQQLLLLYSKGSDFCIQVLNQIDRAGKFLNFVNNVGNSLTSLFGAIAGVATAAVAHGTGNSNTSGNSKDDTDNGTDDSSSSTSSSSETKKQLEANRDIFRNLLCLFHPKCVEGVMALDCSPLTGISGGSTSSNNGVHIPLHSSLLPGVCIVIHRNIREIIQLAIGGITCFLPLFQHLDVLSPPAIQTGGTGTGSNQKRTNRHTSIGDINASNNNTSSSSAVSSSSSSNSTITSSPPSRIRSQSSILPLLLRTLQLMLRDSYSNQYQFLSFHGFQIISYLIIKYASPIYHLCESLIPTLEEMAREFSWGVSMTRLQQAVASGTGFNSLQSFDENSNIESNGSISTTNNGMRLKPGETTNPNLPVSRAGEKTLYNDFMLHILLNFSLWFRPYTAGSNNNGASSKQSDGSNTYSSSTSSTSSSSSSASSALDSLSTSSISFPVQFELLNLIHLHIKRSPRYFRRLLSNGGGSGIKLNINTGNIGIAASTHAAGGSVGPVKFIIDSLRRFLSYQNLLEQFASVSNILSPTSSNTNTNMVNSYTLIPNPFFHPFLSMDLAVAIRNTRTLRKEWFDILTTLILCGTGSSGGAASMNSSSTENISLIRETDIQTLLQLICEASESAASSITTNNEGNNTSNTSSSSTPSLSILTLTHSWLLVELLDLLVRLLRLRPHELNIILVKHAGLQLFISILSRNVRFQHVQVAIIHVISALLSSSPNHPDQIQHAAAGALASLQIVLAECYLTAPTYAALLELALNLSAGSIGSASAAEEAVERFCTALIKQQTMQQHQSNMDSGEINSSGAASAGSSSSPIPPSPRVSSSPTGSNTSASGGRSTTPSPHSNGASFFLAPNAAPPLILFPRALEIIHTLIRHNDLLREKENTKMKEKWSMESIKFINQLKQKQNQMSSSTVSVNNEQNESNARRSSDNIHFEDDSSSSSSTSSNSFPSLPPFSLFHPTFNPLVGNHLFPLYSPLVSLNTLILDISLCIRDNSSNASNSKLNNTEGR